MASRPKANRRGDFLDRLIAMYKINCSERYNFSIQGKGVIT